MKDKFIWNLTKTGSVNLEKVRNFTINFTANGVEVIAWFSDQETYPMGRFKDADEAVKFLDKIQGEHK
jgi:hypothetical protein